jgi:diketogulonate reductase-like aldo/keto reductase
MRRRRPPGGGLRQQRGRATCTTCTASTPALPSRSRSTPSTSWSATAKVRYLACSNQAAWQIAVALGIAERDRLHHYVALQAYYNLVARELEWDLLPLCQAAGLGVLVWSPLAAGLLTGKAGPTGPAPPNTRRARVGDLGIGPVDGRLAAAVLDALRSVAAGRGVSMAQVALNWVRSRAGVTSVIVGARDRDQLSDNLAAAGWQLETEEVDRLDAASSRPLPYPHWYQRQFTAERFSRGGSPPEAYEYPDRGGPAEPTPSDDATVGH